MYWWVLPNTAPNSGWRHYRLKEIANMQTIVRHMYLHQATLDYAYWSSATIIIMNNIILWSPIIEYNYRVGRLYQSCCQILIHVTCPTHTTMHVQWNGGCVDHEASCSQIRLGRRIRCRSKYSIAGYTWLRSWVQAFHTLEKKVKPKRQQIWHFRAELRSLRAPPPTQIALSPPYPIAVSSMITTTNSNHFVVHNNEKIKKLHACKTFFAMSKAEIMTLKSLYTTTLGPSFVFSDFLLSLCVCVCVCVCVCEREREWERTQECTSEFEHACVQIQTK